MKSCRISYDANDEFGSAGLTFKQWEAANHHLSLDQFLLSFGEYSRVAFGDGPDKNETSELHSKYPDADLFDHYLAIQAGVVHLPRVWTPDLERSAKWMQQLIRSAIRAQHSESPVLHLTMRYLILASPKEFGGLSQTVRHTGATTSHF